MASGPIYILLMNMNDWRQDNPHAFGDEIDRSNPQSTR